MAELFLLIGLPGSGKSTLANQLLNESSDRRLISTDAIRADLFGDERIQGNWLLIWQAIAQQFRAVVAESQQNPAIAGIYDATNVVRKQRRQAIALARDCGFTQITGIWVNTPIWLCVSRNRQRDRQVPKDVIYRMNRRLQGAPPALADGCDRLFDLKPSAQPFVLPSPSRSDSPE